MPAPLIVFVYNRPEHTRKTIEALASNDLAIETELFIFSDASKKAGSIDRVREVRKYIDSLTDQKMFKKVTIEKAEKNKGLAKSVIDGVSGIIEKYGQVIVVEDDLVSSPDFLKYMNGALAYYKESKKIWSISGYNIPIQMPKDYKEDIYLSYRGCSWGWATWSDRWNKVDWSVADYSDFRNNQQLRRRFNRGGRDLSNMLDMQMHNKIDSWAIRWCYAQFKLDMLTIYPVISRIKNIGFDGSGTHSGILKSFQVEIESNPKDCKFSEPEINPIIVKRFKNYYMSAFQYALIKPKRIIKSILRM